MVGQESSGFAGLSSALPRRVLGYLHAKVVGCARLTACRMPTVRRDSDPLAVWRVGILRPPPLEPAGQSIESGQKLPALSHTGERVLQF